MGSAKENKVVTKLKIIMPSQSKLLEEHSEIKIDIVKSNKVLMREKIILPFKNFLSIAGLRACTAPKIIPPMEMSISNIIKMNGTKVTS